MIFNITIMSKQTLLKHTKNARFCLALIFFLCCGAFTTSIASETATPGGFGFWVDADATDITCFGEEDGTATAIPMDGQAPFTYEWNTGATSQTITGLSEGEYEVTVTDAEGNTDSDKTVVYGPFAAMEVRTSSNFATCNTSPDGSVTAEAKGGTMPYTYTWSDEDGNIYEGFKVENLIPGTFTVTVTDVNGCTVTGEETIELGPEGVWVMITGENLTCNGDADGFAHAGPMTGVPPYTYQWDDPEMQTTQDAVNLSGGIYTVTVTDANGCTGAEQIKILEPRPLILTPNSTNADCEEDNGMLNVDLEGGDYPVSYLWSDGQTGSTAVNLAKGFYSVTVTDDSGCTASIDIEVGDDCDPLECSANAGSLTADLSSPACLQNGSISLSASPNGDAIVPDDYEVIYVLTTTSDLTIIEINNTPDFNVTTPGLYTIHTLVAETSDDTDDNFLNLAVITFGSSTGGGVINLINATGICASLDAAGAPFTVEDCTTPPVCPLPVIESVVVIEPDCNESNGSVIISLVGNEADFSYSWTPNVSNNNSADNIPSGNYSVIIRNNSDPSCPSITENFSVSNVGGPVVTVTSVTPATCNQSDGTATLSPASLQYEWCNGETGNTASQLMSGPCLVTVTDVQNNCVDVITVVIPENNPLTADAEIIQRPDCDQSNGVVNIVGGNGSGNYSYQWNDGSSQASRTDLGAGAYVVTLTDGGPTGCVQVVSFILTDNVPQASITINNTPQISCTGTTDATVDFTIETEDGFVDPAGTVITDANGNEVNNGSLAAGEYCITVRDGNGCVAGGTCFTVNEIPQIDLDLAIAPEGCTPDGTITITDLRGGNGGFTFDWSDLPGADNPQNRTGLSAGSYNVTVTDALGCSVAVNGLNVVKECVCIVPVIESLVVIEPNCNESNGTAIIALVGNEADFSYTWTPDISDSNIADNIPSGSYSVVIRSLSDPECPAITENFSVGNIDGPMVEIISVTPATCNQANGTATISPFGFVYEWCNGETGNNATSLMAGPCLVTVRDTVNNCVSTITVVIPENNPLVANAETVQRPDCNESNGIVNIIVENGSNNYTYEWEDGSDQESRTDLAAGPHSVTVTDNGPTGCVRVVNFILTNNGPQAIITINDTPQISCVGTTDARIDFTIETEDGFVDPVQTIITGANGNEVSNGNLGAGEYCITVRDGNGCIAGGTCFTVNDIPQIDLDLAILPEGCTPDGAITITDLRGGNGGFTFDWSDLAGDDNPQNRTGLMAGTYSVTMTDAVGCSVAVNGLNVLKECDCLPPVIESVVIVESTCGNMDGRVTVNAAGNPGDFTYAWNDNISVTNRANNLSAGTYSVTITKNDDPECLIVETFTVGNSDGPEIDISTTRSVCGENSGTATLTPAAFNYVWSDGSTDAARTNLAGGVYQVTIVDPANPDCFDVQTVVVDEAPGISATATVNNQPEPGMSDGSATINPSGGSGNYTYSWGPDATRDDLSAGLYAVIVTDTETGCETRVIFVLNNSGTSNTVTVNTITPGLCAGSNTGQVDLSLDLDPDFNGPERIVIQDPNGNTYTNGELPTGEYCALVYDAADVLATSTCFTVSAVPQIDIDLSIDDMSCINPGGIEIVSIIGGNGDYSYAWSDNANPGADPLTLTDLEAGTYGLTVTDANGCIVSENFDVTDDSYPIQVMLEGMNLGCDGIEDGTVNSTVIGAMGAVEYSWSDSSSTQNLMDLPAGTYELTVTDENGCTGISSATIIGPVEVEIILPGDTTVCSNPFIIGADANADGLTYTWTDANGNILGMGSELPINVSGDSTEVFLVAADSLGCTTTDSINLINSTPMVELEEIMMACAGETTQLNLNNMDPGDMLTYMWEPADLIVDGADTGTPTVNIEEAGSVTITGTVTNQFGCTTTVSTTIVSPDLSLNLPDTLTTCVGIPAGLNPDGNENLVYVWSPAEFLNDPTAANPFLNAPAGTNQIIEVMVSDSTGNCSSTEMIEAIVPAELTDLMVPADNFLCEGGEVMLSAGGPGVSEVNYFDEDGLLLGTGNDISLPVGDTTSSQFITVQYLDENGCPTTETVNIGNAAFLLELESEAQNCAENPIILEPLLGLDMGLEISYNWSPEMHIIDATPDSSSITVQPPSTQVYEVIATNPFGCTQTTSTEVQITDLNTLTDLEADRDTIFQGETTDLFATYNEEYTYEWEPANTLDDPASATPEASPLETTTYTVTITDEQGCTATKRTTVTTLTPECNHPFIFFPNAFTPNDDGFNDVVRVRAAFAVDEVYFIIYSRWGEKMFEGNSLDDEWDGTFKNEKLCSDVYAYYLRVRCTNGEEYIKKGNITLLK